MQLSTPCLWSQYIGHLHFVHREGACLGASLSYVIPGSAQLKYYTASSSKSGPCKIWPNEKRRFLNKVPLLTYLIPTFSIIMIFIKEFSRYKDINLYVINVYITRYVIFLLSTWLIAHNAIAKSCKIGLVSTLMFEVIANLITILSSKLALLVAKGCGI